MILFPNKIIIWCTFFFLGDTVQPITVSHVKESPSFWTTTKMDASHFEAMLTYQYLNEILSWPPSPSQLPQSPHSPTRRAMLTPGSFHMCLFTTRFLLIPLKTCTHDLNLHLQERVLFMQKIENLMWLVWFLGFPGGSDGKSACNARYLGSISESGSSHLLRKI